MYNMSPKESEVEDLLLIEESGSIAAREFLEKRILTSEVNFHNPIRKVKTPTFQETSVKVKKNGSEKIVYANGDIISRLLPLSMRFEKSIDFRYASTYPLYPFPVSMAFPDGSERDPSKSNYFMRSCQIFLIIVSQSLVLIKQNVHMLSI